ncbi:MAG: RNA-binding protein [Firmicutes bacterium]|nr:RNA-binding protein [Bacillota bacterium]
MGLLTVGQLVTSKTGRDSGRMYVVIGFYDKSHVKVADGLGRTVSNPKKKNTKHLVAHQAVLGAAELRDDIIRRFIESHCTAENRREEGSTVYGER